jgi:signal transduction histidine kinase
MRGYFTPKSGFVNPNFKGCVFSLHPTRGHAIIIEKAPRMPSFFEQVFLLLTTNPGNLAYHLVLAFSIAGVLPNALTYWSQGSFPARRLAVGLILLLVLRLGLFAAAALSWQNLLPLSNLLPAIDRAVTYVSLVIILWLWLAPQPQKFLDAVLVLAGLLVAILAAIGLLSWAEQGQNLAYNGSWLDTTGEITAAVLAGAGLLLLLILRPPAWGTGLGMVGLLLAGHVAHLAFPVQPGDYSGVIRLAQMAAFPLLFILSQRLTTPALTQPQAAATRNSNNGFDPAFLEGVIDLSASQTPETTYPAAAHMVARLMGADVCLLVDLPEARDQMLALGGYNLTKAQPLPPFTISTPLGYTVGNALRRGRPLRLPASSTSGDELGLAPFLKISRLGHLLAAPVPASENRSSLGLILLAPYSNRSWSSIDQDNLTILAEQVAKMMAQTGQVENLHRQAEDAERAVEELKRLVEPLQRENVQLLTHLEEARQVAAQAHTRAESLAALVANSENSADALVRLQAELREANQAAGRSTARVEVEQAQAELLLALEEIAYLKSQLTAAGLSPGHAPDSQAFLSIEQAVTPIARDLRQPISSVLDYAENLLSESLGPLSSGQRKSVERIKVSAGRMQGLLDDLLQAAAQAAPPENQQPGPLADLHSVIEEAAALSAGPVREKNLQLKVDIPADLPPIRTEGDVLQQICLHLLQNAIFSSPQAGEVSVQARLSGEAPLPNQVLLQVADQGPEVPVEDRSRIFSRLYRPPTGLLAAEGNSGVGLSLVKSLVEAHGGQIWVDSNDGSGSIFSVLLPCLVTLHPGNGNRSRP